MKKLVLLFIIVFLSAGGFVTVDALASNLKMSRVISSTNDGYESVKTVVVRGVYPNSDTFESHFVLYVRANMYYIQVAEHQYVAMRRNTLREYAGQGVSFYKYYVRGPKGVLLFFNI